jgi:hypothetical protein
MAIVVLKPIVETPFHNTYEFFFLNFFSFKKPSMMMKIHVVRFLNLKKTFDPILFFIMEPPI